MTESQPEGSETMRDAMEEELIEESAFERKAPASQSKSNKKAEKFSWLTEKVEFLLIV